MKTITVLCPDCRAELRVDAESGAIIEHRAAPGRARHVNLDQAGEQLRREEQARDARFQQSVAAERRRDQVLEEKFRQSLRRVKENPDLPNPIRDVDLD